MACAVENTTGKACLGFEDENKVIDFPFTALRVGSYCEGVIIEERDTGDTDEHVLARGPAEGSRNGNLNTIIGEKLDMAAFTLEGAEEVGSE